MPYVYRYIDIQKEEVVYVGKVTKFPDRQACYDPLRNRHEQHCREDWYKENEDNLIMEFIEFDNPCDADILESWLINFYDTGQLVNKAKTGWGKSAIDLWPIVSGRWRIFGLNSGMRDEEIRSKANELVDTLKRYTEGYTVNVDSQLTYFCEQVKKIQREWKKAHRISRYDAQDLFLRAKNKEVTT